MPPTRISRSARRLAVGIAALTASALLAACGPTAGAASAGHQPTATLSASAAPSAPAPTTAAPATPAPATTYPSATPSPRRTTAAPTHRATSVASTTKPATTTTTKAPTQAPTKAATKPATGCTIVSAAGNCYKAGQFCRTSDLGKTTDDANGRLLKCAMESGRPHWQYA